MNVWCCRVCGRRISSWAYSNAIFCDNDYCRKLAYDFRAGRLSEKYFLLRAYKIRMGLIS